MAVLQIGTVLFEGNRGASAEGVERRTAAALADKGMLSDLPGHEWTGWEGGLVVTGHVVPFHLGGLDEIEVLHGWCSGGTCVPVIRGDGTNLGWHAIAEVSESHRSLARNGIGYEVEWTVRMVRVRAPSASGLDGMIGHVSGLIQRVVSLFG